MLERRYMNVLSLFLVVVVVVFCLFLFCCCVFKFYRLGNWFLNHFGSVCAPQNDRKDTNQRCNVQFQFSFFRSNSCLSRVKSNFANNLQMISSYVRKIVLLKNRKNLIVF